MRVQSAVHGSFQNWGDPHHGCLGAENQPLQLCSSAPVLQPLDVRDSGAGGWAQEHGGGGGGGGTARGWSAARGRLGGGAGVCTVPDPASPVGPSDSMEVSLLHVWPGMQASV